MIAPIGRKKWRRFFQFASALRRAIAAKSKRMALLRTGWKLLRDLGDQQARVTPDLWRQRMRACSRCRIYNRQTKTCGTPGATWIPPGKTELEQLGCGCYMPLKATMEENCWLAEKQEFLNTEGWPKELNSFPINPEEIWHERRIKNARLGRTPATALERLIKRCKWCGQSQAVK